MNCPKVAAVRSIEASFGLLFVPRASHADQKVSPRFVALAGQGCTACHGKLTTAEGCDAVHKSLYQEFVRSSLKGVHSLKEAFRKGVAYVPNDRKLRSQ